MFVHFGDVVPHQRSGEYIGDGFNILHKELQRLSVKEIFHEGVVVVIQEDGFDCIATVIGDGCDWVVGGYCDGFGHDYGSSCIEKGDLHFVPSQSIVFLGEGGLLEGESGVGGEICRIPD